MISIDLEVNPSEILALVGMKGSGKANFIKILSGEEVDKGDHGTIFFNNKLIKFPHTLQDDKSSLVIISRASYLVPNLSVAENIYLGRHFTGVLGQINWNKLFAATTDLFKEFGIDYISPNSLIEELTPFQQLVVKLLKAITTEARIIILDEVTVDLSENSETLLFFGLLKKLKTKEYSIIYIPFKIEEIIDLADKIAILHDGHMVGEICPLKELSFDEIVNRMMGRSEISNPLADSFLERFNITEKEKTIIAYIAKGYSNQEISNKLGITLGTVKNHIYNIFQKTDVKNRMELCNILKL